MALPTVSVGHFHVRVSCSVSHMLHLNGRSHMVPPEERDVGRPFSGHLATKGVLEGLWS